MFKEHVGDIKSTASSSSLTYSNRYLKAYPGSIHALEGFARVIATGGTTEAETNGTLAIKGADRILIFVDLRPIYDPDKPEMKDMEASLAKLPADYGQLLQRHAKLHGELFNRMRLDLGGGADHQRTTEELLAESTYEKPNRALIEKEFDAARYNIISCTGELPPNLQGVWGGTYVPGWASDYTHNGNVPSAIAANLMGNMPELMLAYTTYIESIVPWLEINAKHLFGARGIVLPSRSSTHGFNNALAPNFAGGFWVGGAGWAAHFFYDYYLYTGDRKFLAEHALPFMEKAALFFEDYLYEGPDGKWVFSPTQSPENTPGNTKSQGTFNATMDVAVAKELLRNTIAASRELGRNQDKIARWQQMLDKMPDYMIDEHGIIKEWLTPRLDEQRQPPALLAALSALRRHARRDRAQPRASRRVPEEHRVQARQPLAEQPEGVHVLRPGAARTGRHQSRRRRAGLPLPDATGEPLLAEQPRLDAQSPLAVQHGHQRRHAGGDHQDAGGLGPRETPASARAAQGLADGNDRRRPLSRPDRGPAAALERRTGVECTLRSGKAQTVLLELPAEISAITVEGKGAQGCEGRFNATNAN